ncbi:M16 family metallopeptidase [Rhabdaerophilum calidifontis]|uniref:M16 family metallopeptidase n=1 Tax=Rhabdaerophilum calidifontis TaxID=2604328 RepID=UPI001238B115|nr:pitrilysin family protein [Rhabdaerophilum calidifontis]
MRSADATLPKSVPAARAASPARVRELVTPAGLVVWHVEDYTVPVVSIEFAFLGGAAQDPAGRAGLANLVAGLLDEGAGDLGAEAFQEALEEKAIELSFDASRDRVDGSLRFLAEHAGRAFELLGLAVSAPRFETGAIDRVRAQIIAGLKRDESDPNVRARETLQSRAYAGHPYGRSADGVIAELAAIDRDLVLAQHGRLFARDALRIVAVGAISAEALAAGLDRAFANLPAGARLDAIAPAAMQNAGLREIVDLDIPQSTLLLALPGIARKDPLHMPAMVLNHILGGGSFTSRLWTEVREKRGLAYSVWSMLANRRHGALFLAGTATSNERVAQSLAVILDEIERITREGAGAEELARAKSYLTGSYALRFDTSRKIAHQLLEIRIEELGIDYIDRRNDEVNAVNLDSMAEAGRRLFADARPLIVVAGRPQGI